MTDLQERLPEYGSIGIGLEDGKSKGQHDPIFWKKERFELLDHGFFWFAEDINAIGQRAWDAASPRMGSWAILKDKISKRKLFFMNVHIDHIGQVARRESAKLILDRLGALAGDLPVIVTGDFNAEPDSEPIRILLDPANPEHLTHTRSVAPNGLTTITAAWLKTCGWTIFSSGVVWKPCGTAVWQKSSMTCIFPTTVR